MTLCTIHNTRTGAPLGHGIVRADGSLTRVVGLLGRRSLAPGDGLWITPSNGIHTLAMRFPIDVVGLDRDFRIVRLWPRLPPWRIPLPSLRLRSVLELAPGEVARHGLALGDTLHIA